MAERPRIQPVVSIVMKSFSRACTVLFLGGKYLQNEQQQKKTRSNPLMGLKSSCQQSR